MRPILLLALLALAPNPGLAQMPMPRPASVPQTTVPPPPERPAPERTASPPAAVPPRATAVATSLWPAPRPDLPQGRTLAAEPDIAGPETPRAPERPDLRAAERRDEIGAPAPLRRSRQGQAVCGVLGLVAQRRAPVDGPGGCGIREAVVVSQVAGVSLSTPALLSCRAVQALDRWVRSAAIPAVGRRGGGLDEMQVAAHYSCRPRNRQAGAKLSEHGKGNAIDIASFALRDGSQVVVKTGWRGAAADRKLLRRLHDSACGPFGTVLGPDGDRFHQDHLHFDVAEYRSGSYCR